MPEEDLVELKFRLYDGTDIGPFRYSSASTVAMLKERIVADWPRDKKIMPKAASDVKLISAGKILENNKTIAQCRIPFGELPGGVITMHVVVQPSVAKTKAEKKVDEMPKKSGCAWEAAWEETNNSQICIVRRFVGSEILRVRAGLLSNEFKVSRLGSSLEKRKCHSDAKE
ncbi:hypothetical protein H6P81_012498 [Aristolochia fimbriata]|uniref:Ubiquitin-like domain-containing protein n=1 Tax=Aristolochia fimbriata TaxID=158543 RepID=A0AAV7EBY7_ARIFI|nr:hypothetical protein H6P81_012498 [Aristolochia fimbriata]